MALVLLACLALAGCSGGMANRPFFKRSGGGYTAGIISTTPANPGNSHPAVHRNSLRDRLKETADSYLGVPYRWGGQSRKGMDCSGFIRQVYQQVYDVKLPHNSGKLAGQGRGVKQGNLKKGDIVLFGSLLGIHHAGIYMQDRKFIHASTSKGVIYSSLDEKYYRTRYKGARRIVN